MQLFASHEEEWDDKTKLSHVLMNLAPDQSKIFVLRQNKENHTQVMSVRYKISLVEKPMNECDMRDLVQQSIRAKVENFGQFNTKEKWYNSHYGIEITSTTKKELVQLRINFTLLENMKVWRHKVYNEKDEEGEIW